MKNNTHNILYLALEDVELVEAFVHSRKGKVGGKKLGRKKYNNVKVEVFSSNVNNYSYFSPRSICIGIILQAFFVGVFPHIFCIPKRR